MKVRFKEDVATKSAETGKEEKFVKDEVVDFYDLYGEGQPAGMTDEEFERNRRQRAEASARHWVSRGKAEAEPAEMSRRGRQAPAAQEATQPQPAPKAAERAPVQAREDKPKQPGK